MKKMFLTALAVIGFWTAGTAAQVCFRLGNDYPDHYWSFFILGCVMGLGATGTAMLTFGLMKNANIAALLLYGCSMIVGQIVLWLCFHSSLTMWQLIGIIMIVIGTMMGTMGKEQKK